MKKVLALLMALMMILSLAACGKKDSDKKESASGEPQAGTEVEQETPGKEEEKPEELPQSTAQIGDKLTQPEALFSDDIEKLYLYFTAKDENGEIQNNEYTMYQVTEDYYVIYLTDGPLKLEEVIYEVHDEEILCYYKDVFASGYTQDTSVDQETLRQKVQDVFDVLAMMGVGDVSGEYYKCADEEYTLHGPAFAYDVPADGDTIHILVNKATGIFTRITGAGFDVTVMDIMIGDEVTLPAYK